LHQISPSQQRNELHHQEESRRIKMHPDHVVIMRRATEVAANFLSNFILSRVEDEQKRRDFVVCLEQLLASRLEHHWYPEHPSRGQAYRCIRLNPSSGREALIETAVIVAGLTYADIQLPLELTVWIDPDSVAYRFGENDGSHCTLLSFEDQFEPLNNKTTTTPQTPIKGDGRECRACQIVFQQHSCCAPCPALSHSTTYIEQFRCQD
jgi:protein Tob/BTG